MKVVTSVLMNRGKILLLKRGTKVRTYRGKWACISGYLEDDDPLHRAIKEIEEETGIKPNEIRLLKKEEEIKFYDENEKIFWQVYPFLFETDKDEIKIDWEHVECRWIFPNEIDKYDTVPKLKETIKKLLGQ
ncbi:MAG: NUDIX domain-containing protein [Thermoplasmatales archaeon]|nr:NUDIX domain-containing protein [Thermoplasmatales archaeon]